MTTTETLVSAPAAELRTLLEAAASGDVEAFMRFFDATSGYAYALELSRAAAGDRRADRVRELAETAVRRRYASAWRFAGEQASQHLSPLAWLLSLPSSQAAHRDTAADPGEEAACA